MCQTGTASVFSHVRFEPESEVCSARADVRFGSKADMCSAKVHVRSVPKVDNQRAAGVGLTTTRLTSAVWPRNGSAIVLLRKRR
jgi:hypothetical protein